MTLLFDFSKRIPLLECNQIDLIFVNKFSKNRKRFFIEKLLTNQQETNIDPNLQFLRFNQAIYEKNDKSHL